MTARHCTNLTNPQFVPPPPEIAHREQFMALGLPIPVIPVATIEAASAERKTTFMTSSWSAA
jgi:hypothetical protein